MKNDLGDGYLRSEDLIHDGVWGTQTYTVTAAHPPNTIRSADKKLIDKDILELEGTDKRLVVGKVNWRLIKYATGIGNKNEIVGRQITLYPSKGNWFGQQNVVALRVRIPDGNYRPFIKPANLGEDITGKRFTSHVAPKKDTPKVSPPVQAAPPKVVPPPPAKKPTPGEMINACSTPKELHEMLANKWLPAKPVEGNEESWSGVLPLVQIKVVKESWGEDQNLQDVQSHIQQGITPNVDEGVEY